MKQGHSYSMHQGPIKKVQATTRTGQFFEGIIESPEKMAKIKKGFYILLGLLVVLDFFIHRHHAAFFWDVIPGFSAVYGLVSTILIIVVSKFIGHALLMKKEDYYD
jgi:hypothetical protein